MCPSSSLCHPRACLFSFHGYCFSSLPPPTCFVSPFSIAHGINNVCRALLWCKYLYQIRRQVWKGFANLINYACQRELEIRISDWRVSSLSCYKRITDDVNKQGKGLHFPPVLLMPWKLTAIILFFVNKGERMSVYTMLSFMYGIVEIQELLEPMHFFLWFLNWWFWMYVNYTLVKLTSKHF